MNALNISNFKFEKSNNDYLYIIEIKNNKYILKRILNNSEIIIINIFKDYVEFNCVRNKVKINNLDLFEKDKIINDIINTLNCKAIIDIINFDKLSKLIKDSYIKVIYSNELIGLSVNNDNLINIVLLETNSIIGTIKIDYDVKINVVEVYRKESLELLKSYVKSNKNKRLVLA